MNQKKKNFGTIENKRQSSAAILALLVFSFILIFTTLTPATNTLAVNTIESIDSTVTLYKDASASFRERRRFTVTEGTEHFISFANLEESQLLSFTVYENGVALEDIGQWDTDASLEEKAGKSGIHRTKDGLELCFGIGSYGVKDFVIEYKFSNFVRSLSSGEQAIYWQFLNQDMDPIDRVSIKLTNDFGQSFSFDNSKIWGFGYEGNVLFENGNIFLVSSKRTSKDNYMVLLSIFENAPFAATASYHKSAEEITSQAMDGASLDGKTYDEYLQLSRQGKSLLQSNNRETSGSSGARRSRSQFRQIIDLLELLLMVLAVLFVIISYPFYALGNWIRKRKVKANRKSLTPENAKDAIYKDIPYAGEFFHLESIVNPKTEDLVSAFFLKWLKEGRFQEVPSDSSLTRKKEQTKLKIREPRRDYEGPFLEKQLWRIAKAASDGNFLLDEKSFSSFIRKNTSDFARWRENIEKEANAQMEKEGYYTSSKERILFQKVDMYHPSPEGSDLAARVQGFKNYLKEYSLLEERNRSYVAIWDQYLVWAAYLGIAEEVYEQFKILDPQIEFHSSYHYGTITGTRAYGKAAQASSRNLSSSSYSGGGGSSFSGGGGGASGGGSGGGSR